MRSTLLWAACLIAAAPLSAAAQDKFPSRPIRVVSSTAAASGPDVIGRLLAEIMSRDLGQQLVFENNQTGGGIVAAQQVAAAPPDGYSLLSASASVFTVLPARQDRAPKLGENLRAVGYYGDLPLMICVSPTLGVSTLKELVELTKKDPKKVIYAGNTNGSLPHMSGVLFNSRIGGGLTFVAYRSTADGLKDLLGGQINMIIEGIAPLGGAITAGSIKPLAVTMAKRLSNLPDVPTIGEFYPGYVAQGWAGLFAPAGTPDAIVNQLNASLNAALVRPEVKARLEELGAYVRPLSPAELTAMIEGEQKQWWPIVKELAQQQPPPAQK